MELVAVRYKNFPGNCFAFSPHADVDFFLTLDARGVISMFMSLPSSSFLGFRVARWLGSEVENGLL